MKVRCTVIDTYLFLFIVVKVIKNPVTDHLPAGSLKIGTSYHADQIVDVRKFAEDKPIVCVVGAMAHGKVSEIFLHDPFPCTLYMYIHCVCDSTGRGGLH